MQINTSKKKNFQHFGFVNFQRELFEQTLQKWINTNKKVKKQHQWNQLFYSLICYILPDLQMDQLLINYDILLQKLHQFINLCRFKVQILFTGIEIKLIQAFIALDSSQKIEKVIIQNKQIKQITSVLPFQLIKRSDLNTLERKQKMFLYNRQKNKKTIYLVTEIKVIQKFKNDLFKEDHCNKLKYFSSYVFGQFCPSFCVSGIKILKMDQNQSMKQKIKLNSNNVYFLYHGAVLCYLKSIQDSKYQQDSSGDENIKTQQNQIKKLKLNHQIQNHTNYKDFKNKNIPTKVQLNEGSLIQTKGFFETLKKINKVNFFTIQNCKTIGNSILFQMKCSDFLRVITFDEKLKKHFLHQYELIFKTRKLLFQNSLNSIDLMTKVQQKKQNQVDFSISRRKKYRGFRSKTARNSLQDFENLATVDIYDTMLLNKQKVLSLQKEYKEGKGSPKNNFRYEDSKQIKQNYKKLKIKDHQIQKLAFRNSLVNVKNQDRFQNIKSKMNQVKGMFQDEIEQVQKLIKQQRKAMLTVETNRQNKNFKRKGIRLKSYSPGVNYQDNENKLKIKTCTHSRRVSMGQNLMTNTCDINFSPNLSKSQITTHSKISIKQMEKTQKQIQKSTRFQDNHIQIFINGCKQPTDQLSYNPFKCINNLTHRDIRRTDKKSKTYFKHTRRISKLDIDSKTNLFI